MRRLLFLPNADTPAESDGRSYAARRRQSRCILTAGSCALCVLLLPELHRPTLRLVWNISASVPVGLYRIVPEAAPHRGELVAVRLSPALGCYMAARRYMEAGALLVKPVAATVGQQVCRTGVAVMIDGIELATALVADHLRRPLPSWTGCRRLGVGAVFLLAPKVPASFDSRYFGPVATSDIIGRAVPLWTWR